MNSSTTWRQFAIKRGPLQPGYDILLDEMNLKLYAEMYFSSGFKKQFDKLSLGRSDDDSPDIAVSYMPCASRKIHLGFDDSEKLQEKPHVSWETHTNIDDCGKLREMRWEGMEKMKLSWQGLAKEEYLWMTSLPEREKTLLWTTGMSWPTSHRNYTLLDKEDQETQEAVAEFHSDKSLYMGGVLTIKKICETWSKDFDLKVLMAFLAIYETRRRRSHLIKYRPLEGNNLSNRNLGFLQQLRPPKS